jgi:Icc-related predicted phosphoesterase
MKFLAFVDLHGDKKYLQQLLERAKQEDIDFLLCAGDLSQFGHNLRFVLKQFDSLGKKMYLLPGNHESNDSLNKILPDFSNCENIHGKDVEIENYVFFGYGEGGFAKEDQEFRKVARDWYGKHKERKTVLVTHGPPHGNKTDFLEGRYVGNKDYRAFIERIKPRLAICGHIHETAGSEDLIGETKVINPGWEGMVIELN